MTVLASQDLTVLGACPHCTNTTIAGIVACLFLLLCFLRWILLSGPTFSQVCDMSVIYPDERFSFPILFGNQIVLVLPSLHASPEVFDKGVLDADVVDGC